MRFRPDGTAWVHLENGVEVRFVAGHYRSGDYWHFPARAATVDVESGTVAWPQDGGPALLPPHGITRQRCRLALVDVDPGGLITRIEDCRTLFPPLTELVNLLYVGGDGQEGATSDAVGGFVALPGRLDVRVVNGGNPVAGATVVFDIEAGNGRLDGSAGTVPVVTDAQGLASCQWEIDHETEHQVCVARLVGGSGTPLAHQVVRFSATLDEERRARRGCCWTVGEDGDFRTVSDALSELLERREREICLCLMPGTHRFEGGRFSGERWAHLSVHGCGRGTLLLLERPFVVDRWHSFRLRDLDVGAARDAFVGCLAVSDVEVRGCRISGVVDDVGLVRVYGAARLHVDDCVLVARRQDSFERPREFYDGLDVLRPMWDAEDELARPELTRRAATELAEAGQDVRRELAEELRRRGESIGLRLAAAEAKAMRSLADVLSVEASKSPVPVAHALDVAAQAAVVTRPGVALEVGSWQEHSTDTPGRVTVVVSDNVIAGIVSLYGHTDVREQVDDDTLGRLDAILQDSVLFVGAGGDVHVRDNRFVRLAIGVEMMALLRQLSPEAEPATTVLESIHVANNVIDGAPTETVSFHSTWTANHFSRDGVPRDENHPGAPHNVAHVVGDTATYTGNHAAQARGVVLPAPAAPARIRDVTRSSAEAANLELLVS